METWRFKMKEKCGRVFGLLVTAHSLQAAINHATVVNSPGAEVLEYHTLRSEWEK